MFAVQWPRRMWQMWCWLRGYVARGGAAAAEQAARQVARAQAKALLLPLLDTAIARLAAVLRRTWQLAVDHAVPEGDTS